MMAPFSYRGGPSAPAEYFCSECGAYPCKLWRQYQRLAESVELMCMDCAARDQGKILIEVKEDGTRLSNGQRIDQIGSLVPAVPTEDGSTYWGYTSVPDDGVAWWKSLPLRVKR